MVKITKSGSQYRITIPTEVMLVTRWDKDTEVIFDPYTETPKEKITEDTPFLLKRVENKNQIGIKKKKNG